MNGVAIVTGGTRGIGLAISLALQHAGFSVGALYHANTEAAKHFESLTGGVAIQCDVRDYKACIVALAEIEERIGMATVLVNNAGVTSDGVLHKMPAEKWSMVISNNLDSCFNMCRVVVPGMRQRGYGRVVNIGSVNGLRGQFGQTNYSASKAGILGFTRALAIESARKGITVNAICPGYIDTDMTSSMTKNVLGKIVDETPMGRMGRPEEIAALVRFLASEDAGFITGESISINGGLFMS